MKNQELNSKSGVALLLVLASLFLMSILAYEIIFSTGVEIRIGRNARNRIQATYLAQSSLKFSILRLHLYKEAKNLADTNSQSQALFSAHVIDQIWSLPFPSLPLPGMKNDWPGEVSGMIRSEGSKIPINLLDGAEHRRSDAQTSTKIQEQIKTLIEGLAQDEDFDKLYRGLLPEDLINPLIDWIDADSNKKGGGDENTDYEKFKFPYTPRNDRIPVLSELHMIKGWTDDLIQRIAGNFSILNTSYDINPNFISLDRIKAMHPDLSKEDLQVIQKRRFEKPFTSLQEMADFIKSSPDVRNGRDFSFGDLKLLVRETNFIVEGTGVVGDARRSIKLAIRMTEEKTSNNPDARAPTTPGAGTPTPKAGKLLEPRVIFVEDSQ